MATSSLPKIMSELSIDVNNPFKDLIKDDQMLARGGFGRIFRCKSRTDDGFVCAVKEIDIPLSELDRMEMNKSIDREEGVIKKLMELGDHENIVKIFQHHRTESKFLIFMELAGGDLRSFIYTHGPQQKEVVLKYLRQITNGLRFLHSHQIAHFDMKSGNVLVDCSTNPKVLKICDYGLSKHFPGESSRSTTFGFRGTQAFMAPEVAKARENESKDPVKQIGFNRKSDIWSLGVIGLHLATGQLDSNTPSDVPDELNKYVASCQKDNPVLHILKQLLVLKPENRCDVDSAISLIESKLVSLPKVTCKYSMLVMLTGRSELRSKLTNHFLYHHNDDNAIKVALQIIRSFNHDKWFVVSRNTNDDVPFSGTINVKVNDRMHMFYYHNNPTWKDATEELVKTYLNSIEWTTKSASDVRSAISKHFGGTWECIISSNNDTTVYNYNIYVQLNNGIEFVTVYKWWNY